MLKTLREDGFDARLFERRGRVGGLWSYTDDKTMTTALPSKLPSAHRPPTGHWTLLISLSATRAVISKYTCGFTDFPMPDSERTCILKKRWMVE